MSEFECAQGHPMSSRDLRCKVCGSLLARMDGMTNAQLRAMEDADEYPQRGRRP